MRNESEFGAQGGRGDNSGLRGKGFMPGAADVIAQTQSDPPGSAGPHAGKSKPKSVQAIFDGMIERTHQGNGLSGFGPGVMVETTNGPLPVDWLRAGDRVLTRDRGYLPVLWTGRSRPRDDDTPCSPPVRIFAGAFGKGCPEHDLALSPHHHLLLNAPQVSAAFGAPEILASAHNLSTEAERDAFLGMELSYYHVLLETHELILAEGIWAESLWATPDQLALMPPDHIATLQSLGTERPFSSHRARRAPDLAQCPDFHPRQAVAGRRMSH